MIYTIFSWWSRNWWNCLVVDLKMFNTYATFWNRLAKLLLTFTLSFTYSDKSCICQISLNLICSLSCKRGNTCTNRRCKIMSLTSNRCRILNIINIVLWGIYVDCSIHTRCKVYMSRITSKFFKRSNGIGIILNSLMYLVVILVTLKQVEISIRSLSIITASFTTHFSMRTFCLHFLAPILFSLIKIHLIF